jgi:hypothetical protein
MFAARDIRRKRRTDMLETRADWTADWLWSLPLIAATLAIHAAGLVTIAAIALKFEPRGLRGAKPVRRSHPIVGSTLVIALVGIELVLLHGFEAALWAAAYLGLGAFASYGDAMLFSLDSMTTRGASGLTPAPHWVMMGALEATCGVLAFGASTAFLFSVLQGLWATLRTSGSLPEAPDGAEA